MKPGKQHYVFLDGMRGVAAIVVLGVHTSSIFGLPALFASGSLAVDLFFCLSGFVVARAYDAKMLHQNFSWLMSRRVARLYPMIVFAIAVSAALAFIEGKTNIITLSTAALIMFPVSLITGGTLAFPLNLPMWSLFFEMAGSVAYAVERNRASVRLLLSLVVTSGLILVVMMVFGHIENFGVGGKTAFLVGFPRMIYPFAIGVLFARISIKVPPITDWRLALVMLVLFAIPASKIHVGLCCIVFLPAMVLLGSNAKISFPSAWDWLGRVSYPLYLLHVPVLEASRYFCSDWPLYFTVPFAISLSIVSAILALLLYDEPLRSRYQAYKMLRHDR